MAVKKKPESRTQKPKKKVGAKRGRGRPTKYSKKLADRICEQLALGYSIRTVCHKGDMPSVQTFFRWLRKYDEFREQYARAKQEAADAMAEDILDIADDATNDWMEIHRRDAVLYRLNGEHVQRSKLRIEARKFLMAKMKPKVYGQKIDLTSDGRPLHKDTISDEELNAILSKKTK